MNRAAGMGLHVDGSAVQHTKFDVKCLDHIQTVLLVFIVMYNFVLESMR